MSRNGKVRDINELRERIKQLENDIISDIKDELNDTPDLQGVRRLSQNIVVVPFSSLDITDWTPAHYNTKQQISIIIEKIENKSLEQCIEIFNNIYKFGIIEVGKSKTRINNSVKEMLKQLLISLSEE